MDLVVAAYCVYIDQDGETPSVPGFVDCVRALSGEGTRVVVCQEVRSSEVSASLARELERHFHHVVRVTTGVLPPVLRQEYVEIFECRVA